MSGAVGGEEFWEDRILHPPLPLPLPPPPSPSLPLPPPGSPRLLAITAVNTFFCIVEIRQIKI